MKKRIMLFLLLAMVTKVHGQYITAIEMMAKAKCKTFECFNEFIIERGFSFSNSPEKDENRAIYIFTSDKWIEDSESPNMPSKNIFICTITKTGTLSDVGIRTRNKEYYLRLLTEFKSKGFKLSADKKVDDGIASIYKSKAYPNLLLTVTVEKLSKNGHEWTSYDFQVEPY